MIFLNFQNVLLIIPGIGTKFQYIIFIVFIYESPINLILRGITVLRLLIFMILFPITKSKQINSFFGKQTIYNHIIITSIPII